MGDLLVGSWLRTAVAAILVLLVFGVAVWAGATGRLADLRYANIPWVHPYPPAGYFINPLNPSADRGDLVDTAAANRVKADLLQDGQEELQALATGDEALAAQADTGNALRSLQQLIAQNNAAGIFERQETHIDSIVVGKLADPNQVNVSWCVLEKGTGTLTKYRKSDGEQITAENVRVEAKFWLVLKGDRYLITDTQISAQPVAAA